MNQTALHFPPASHRNDPATSRQAEAAITQSGARQTQAELVLDLVREHGGLTSAELTQFCDLDRWQIARRLPDLEANGLVIKGNARRCTITNKASVVWWLA